MNKKINMKPGNNFPMMEYFAPRRTAATPMTRKEARELNVLECEQGTNLNELGFLVKEPIGRLVFDYWMPEGLFNSAHIRTNRFTIGEVPIQLHQGIKLRRPNWPPNEWIEWRKEETLKDYTEGKPATISGFIAKVGIYRDPVKENEYDFVVSYWNPTQDDIFAKDFQRLNLNNQPMENEDKHLQKLN